MNLALLSFLPIVNATPDSELTSYELGGDVVAIAVSQSADSADSVSSAIFLDSLGDVSVLDTETWSLSSHPSPCTTTNDIALWSGSATLVFVACDDGSVGWLELSGKGELSSTADNTYSIADSSISHIIVDESCVWAATQEDSQVYVSCFDPELSEVAEGPYTTARSGLNHLAQTDSHLVVLHGGDDITKLDKSSGSAATNQDNLSGRDFIDAASDGSNSVFLVDGGGAVVKYRLTTNDYQVVLNESDDLENLSSIAVELESDESWVAISETDLHEVRFYPLEPSTGTIGDTLVDTLEASNVVAMERVDEDTLLVGQANGLVTVLSSAIWVEVTRAPEEVLLVGDTVDVTFFSDSDTTYELRVESMEGDLLASGESLSGEETSATFVVDSTFEEGTIRVFVVVEGDNREGHDAFDITIDNPPSRVELAEGDVRFGDESLIFSFQGVDDEDLDHYVVYVSDTLFASDDWGSVSATGDTYELSGYGSGELVAWTLGSLINGQPYYVAVSAVDSAGTEGPMSDVLTATSSEVVGAAELSGNSGGGYGCGSLGRTGGAFLALVSIIALSGRRKGLAMTTLVALSVGSNAYAGTSETGSVEFSFGTVVLEDSSIESVYGGEVSTVNFENTWRLHQFVEVGLNAGFGRSTSWALSATDQTASGYASRFTVAPVGVSASLLLDFVDGQPIVPWAQGSLDYWLWGERIDSGDGYLAGESFSGGKATYSYSYGANLLLDTFSPSRASLAEAKWGIKDTYLTVEFQRTEMISQSDGLGFANNSILFGLKVDR